MLSNKIRVTFSAKEHMSKDSIDQARREANALPMCEWNNKFRIYIPEKLAEVMGCISWSAKESTNEIVRDGKGKFKNLFLPDVNILDATRFMRKVEEPSEKSEMIKTNTVRLTFAGLVLPEYLNINGLLVPVREFRRRQMFCEKCLCYNYTQSHCNNKPKKVTELVCFHCQGQHLTGDKTCPRRKFFENRDKDREKELQKKRMRKCYFFTIQIL